MTGTLEKSQGIIVAGVGGQGAITLAQLILVAAWRCGYCCMQSEVHGMSQRGGAVNAHVVFDDEPVTSPTVMEGDTDILIGMEPLETLRYVHMVKKKGIVISSLVPIKNIVAYPNEEEVLEALRQVPNIALVDTRDNAKRPSDRQAGNMTLLGLASHYMPIDAAVWSDIFKERFTPKGEKVVQTNIEAFEFGRNSRINPA